MMVAMQQQVDTVFLLANGWGHLVYTKAPAKPWSESKKAKYEELKKKAHALFAEDNKKLREKGEPERVLVGRAVIRAYFPNAEMPPLGEHYYYTPRELREAFVAQRAASRAGTPTTSGLGRRSKKGNDKFSFNVVQFVPESGHHVEKKFKQATNIMDGEYRAVPGLEAIERYTKSGAEQ